MFGSETQYGIQPRRKFEIKFNPTSMGRKLQDSFAYYGPLTTKTALALHHLFLYQDPPLSHPLIGSSQHWAKHFPQLQSCVSLLRSTPMKMERIESSETSEPKAQTPGDYPKDTM